jgi:hypothetical protein
MDRAREAQAEESEGEATDAFDNENLEDLF